jgi:hypothetical protein
MIGDDVIYKSNIAVCQSYLKDIREFLTWAENKDASDITDVDLESARYARVQIVTIAMALHPKDWVYADQVGPYNFEREYNAKNHS